MRFGFGLGLPPGTGAAPAAAPTEPAIFLLLLSGDQQTGTDRLLLSGDQQTGTDGLLLSGDQGS